VGGVAIGDEVTARRPRARAGWAWFAGGDGRVLALVPSEASFLNGLGMWVVGMAVVSGFAMTVAASQWWSTSIVSVLWVVPLWAVLYCLIERLVLKSFGTSRLGNLVLTIPRLLLSLAIALVVGLPMAQVIYSGSINDEVSKTTTARIQQATADITRTYDARIAAAQKEVDAARSQEASLQRQVTNSTFLSQISCRSSSVTYHPRRHACSRWAAAMREGSFRSSPGAGTTWWASIRERRLGTAICGASFRRLRRR
jgi:hypothetical protein